MQAGVSRWSDKMLLWIALVTVLAMGLVSCREGREKGRQTPSAAQVRQYCTSALAIETIPEPAIDFDALSPEQQAEEAKKFARESIRPLANNIVANAPEQVKEEIAVLNNAVREVENTGNLEAFNKPEVVQASKVAHEFDLKNCGWGKVEVTAVNYAFGGVPKELKRGATSFELTNNGTEHHEMVIFRKNDDATESFDELLALPEDQAETKVTFVAASDATPKQEGVYTVASLRPGEYAMVCFIPVGSTPEAEAAAEAAKQEIQGPPHYTRGMKSEFTIK
jgi:uncharacterized cupredoxin-like copper-binding protein